MYCVYVISNTVNSLEYIGTCKNLQKRWYKHKDLGKNLIKDWPLYRAMNEIGIDKFRIDVIATCKTREDAFSVETAIILQNNTLYPNGYNQRAAGVALPEKHAENIRSGLRKDEVRKLISEQQKIISNTPEMREKRRLAFLGKSHSLETRLTMNASKRGKAQSPDHIAKLTAIRRGKICITNGVENTTIRPDSGIPEGWWRGTTKNQPRKYGRFARKEDRNTLQSP